MATQRSMWRGLTSESVILKTIQRAAYAFHMRLFRNQVGRYRVHGRWISSGLCVGSSDLIGWTCVTITPAMVGRTMAVFTAIETKREGGHVTAEQEQFLAEVTHAGGISAVVSSLDDVQVALVGFRL